MLNPLCRHRTFPQRTGARVAAGATESKPNAPQATEQYRPVRTNVSQAFISCLQTALTAQIHKRAWLPSRLKVTLVTRIFRPSTGRLRFLIHALWNVSYTCHLANSCNANSILLCHMQHSMYCDADASSMHRHTSELRYSLHNMANKINTIPR